VSREKAIANTKELFRGSSHLLSVPTFTTMKDLQYNWSRKITWCHNCWISYFDDLMITI